MKRCGFFVAYLLAQSILCAAQSSSLVQVPVTDCKTLNQFFDLWRDSYYGKASLSYERATWIQFNETGGYEFLRWDKSSEMKEISWNEHVPSITWEKKVPPNVIALAHTHPVNVPPKPSPRDVEVAKKLNIYVYTISNDGIWKAAPDGTITREADYRWQYKQHGQLVCKDNAK